MATEHDRAVLNSILDPSLPLGDVMNFEAPQEEILSIDPDEPAESDSEECRRSRQLERDAVQAAEAGDHQTALRLLTEAVSAAPQRPSPYNNRAQLYRLMHRNDDALSDADRAVELSGGRGLAGRQALCQRGQLHQLAGQQERALDDYRRAAALGSRFAKTQLVALNPYAALCNRMLGEVIGRLQRGEPDEPKS
ncbi:Tetratricopeptide repeat protein 36 [Amphibalanus amphitrite]|uniref:Tetratricopeptide repeat protein 36 n=1 Tax=Amphibalanus amphitrite TaxID=1232801 RepID=A0A6A4VTD4_AMPAM|nr:tetratricopeptide repeat protein 36-like [Amphibalanus amphitrite]XP_043189241.1 tetratricopeptide repeat protein 36-like [Amphibalanus amphitrite]XP_043189242.1 tetratricopeptide repeat protein 36-like [Amphibalanus amphitrite]KAF0294670.1 Tetratricopeptide repeat protein 36 [Amphibalanus amphitrite]